MTLPDWLTSADASDASGGSGILPSGIRPLVQGQRLAAPAFTVQAAVDDNGALRAAVVAPPPPGSILVVAGHDRSVTATTGGNVAFNLREAGVVGLVTDGLVRDSQELVELEFPVWSRGVTPRAPGNAQPGTVGVAVVIGGVEIRTGDIVIADDDGIVVWPQAELTSLLARAAEQVVNLPRR